MRRDEAANGNNGRDEAANGNRGRQLSRINPGPTAKNDMVYEDLLPNLQWR